MSFCKSCLIFTLLLSLPHYPFLHLHVSLPTFSPTPNIQSYPACRPRQRMSFKNIMCLYAHGPHCFCFQLDMAMSISPLVLVVMQYPSLAYPFNRNATPMALLINLIQKRILVHRLSLPFFKTSNSVFHISHYIAAASSQENTIHPIAFAALFLWSPRWATLTIFARCFF